MKQEDVLLAAMAEIGALRRLTVHAIAMRLLEESAPLEALSFLGLQMTRAASVPPDTQTGLDPAISDLLAAMTDERVLDLVGDLGRAVASVSGGEQFSS